MKTVTCDPLTIALRLPPCALAITAATLTRQGQPNINLVATPGLTAADGSTPILLSGIPSTARRGVWKLSLVSECGCYETNVFLDLCVAPQLPSTYTPTEEMASSQECCIPDLTATWPSPVISLEIDKVEGEWVVTLDPVPLGLTATYDGTTLTFVGTPAPIPKVVTIRDESAIVIATGNTPSFEAILRCTTYYATFTPAP